MDADPAAHRRGVIVTISAASNSDFLRCKQRRFEQDIAERGIVQALQEDQ